MPIAKRTLEMMLMMALRVKPVRSACIDILSSMPLSEKRRPAVAKYNRILDEIQKNGSIARDDLARRKIDVRTPVATSVNNTH
jgi:hypothetical protein